VAQDPHRGPINDVRRLPGVLAGLPAELPVAWVVADRELDHEANHQYIHRVLGAESAIPVRRHGAPRPGAPLSGRYRVQMAVPRADGAAVPDDRVWAASPERERLLGREAQALAGRSLATQCRQALVLGLAYDVYWLKPCPAVAA
jgi:hypothetical protein